MGMKTDWTALHGSKLRNVPVLVTGGAGFVGSHLVEALVALGARVDVFDDLSGPGDDRNLSSLDAVRATRGSILDIGALAQIVRDKQIVFHVAGRVSVPQSLGDPRAYHEANGTGTLNVLEATRTAGVSRVVYSASSSAYGDAAELPKVETMPTLPRSPYAASKAVGEAYVSAFAACYPIDAVSLRYFNIFGPRQNPHSPYSGVIAAFSKAILSGQSPRITGDGSASRDFTFVHNAVHANLLAAVSPNKLNGDVINVGTGVRHTVLELAAAMARLFGRTDLAPTFAPARPGDVLHSLADLTKASALLGYTPIVDFETGLAETTAWYKQSLGG
jgi:UDP-glucose 4-epimerase